MVGTKEKKARKSYAPRSSIVVKLFLMSGNLGGHCI